ATSFFDVILVILPYAIGAIVALGLLSLFMTEQGRSRYESVLCAVAILLWLQSNILVWNYGVLDGSDINWMVGAWRGALDIVIWAVVLWLAISAYVRFGKALLVGAIVTFAIQLISSTSILITHPDVLDERDIESSLEGRDATMRFSREQNIVHIVMDGFQSDIFEAILADTTERDFKSELRGFTYFDQHLGAYPYTQLTLPALLSGELYRNQEPVESFVSAALGGQTITNVAFAEGYEVDVAAPTALKNVYVLGDTSNAYGISPSGHVDVDDFARSDSARLMDLALFRGVPHFAKALVHRDELWVFQATSQADAYLQMQYFSDLAYLNDLATDMTVDRDVPVYKLIHVMLSHRPIVGNERCEFGGRKPESRAAVRTHAQCGLLGVLSVLQRMKDLGIYDSSLIVLMADHGAWVPVEDFAESDAVNALTVAMATPVLAVKPPDTPGEFQVSSAPSSIVDIPATIADIAGFSASFGGQSVFSINATASRPRRHLVYGYGINPKAEGYLFPMQEFVVDGSPYDAESWRKAERHLPND
ncbi:MAG: sulfatase-like hydrolase/transferase, partial [Woeseiaceae bacterium]